MVYLTNRCDDRRISDSTSTSWDELLQKTTGLCSQVRSRCCPNSLIYDHTYCVLKRICHKIFKDYNRNQCREKYTLFDGGNSVNVRIHRSSCAGIDKKQGDSQNSEGCLRQHKSNLYYDKSKRNTSDYNINSLTGSKNKLNQSREFANERIRKSQKSARESGSYIAKSGKGKGGSSKPNDIENVQKGQNRLSKSTDNLIISQLRNKVRKGIDLNLDNKRSGGQNKNRLSSAGQRNSNLKNNIIDQKDTDNTSKSKKKSSARDLKTQDNLDLAQNKIEKPSKLDNNASQAQGGQVAGKTNESGSNQNKKVSSVQKSKNDLNQNSNPDASDENKLAKSKILNDAGKGKEVPTKGTVDVQRNDKINKNDADKIKEVPTNKNDADKVKEVPTKGTVVVQRKDKMEFSMNAGVESKNKNLTSDRVENKKSVKEDNSSKLNEKQLGSKKDQYLNNRDNLKKDIPIQKSQAIANEKKDIYEGDTDMIGALSLSLKSDPSGKTKSKVEAQGKGKGKSKGKGIRISKTDDSFSLNGGWKKEERTDKEIAKQRKIGKTTMLNKKGATGTSKTSGILDSLNYRNHSGRTADRLEPTGNKGRFSRSRTSNGVMRSKKTRKVYQSRIDQVRPCDILRINMEQRDLLGADCRISCEQQCTCKSIICNPCCYACDRL